MLVQKKLYINNYFLNKKKIFFYWNKNKNAFNIKNIIFIGLIYIKNIVKYKFDKIIFEIKFQQKMATPRILKVLYIN